MGSGRPDPWTPGTVRPGPSNSSLPLSSPPPRRLGARLRAFLRAHPILFLALLTPGIPEYLSGSSPFANIVLDPAWFALGLAFNLALYLPGVLLIREAFVRWNKGWATVLTLGAAYAIVEEGIALSTMFDPLSGAAGASGAYGHSFGVNWVWVPEIMLVHMLYSIALPILLFGYVFPGLRQRPLLERRGIAIAFAVLVLDVLALAVFVHSALHFWMGDAVLAGALAAVLGLVLLAYAWPSDLLRPAPGPARSGAMAFGVVGAVFYEGLLLLVSVLESYRLSVVLVTLSVPVYASAFWVWIWRNLGRPVSDRTVFALALGLIVPIMAIGIITQLSLPIVLVADALVVLFFRYLWRRYPGTPDPPASWAAAAG
jgi:hypothetical protein